MSKTYITGIRGCAAKTKRGGEVRYCAQQWTTMYKGKSYCWYHNPEKPHRFGEGYYSDFVREGKDPYPSRSK